MTSCYSRNVDTARAANKAAAPFGGAATSIVRGLHVALVRRRGLAGQGITQIRDGMAAMLSAETTRRASSCQCSCHSSSTAPFPVGLHEMAVDEVFSVGVGQHVLLGLVLLHPA